MTSRTLAISAARAALVAAWFACGGALLVVAITRLDVQRLTDALAGAAWMPLGLAVVLDVAVMTTKAAKWRVLLAGVGAARVTRLLLAYYAGGVTSVAVPMKLDEVVRAAVAVRLSGLRWPGVLGSMVAERTVDLVGLLGALALLGWWLPVPDWMHAATRNVGWLAAAGAVTVVVLRAAAPRLALRGRLGRLMGGIAGGSEALWWPRTVAVACALCAVEWTLNVGIVACACAALGLTLPPAAWLLVITLFGASVAIPLAPAGIGVFEVAVMLALPAVTGVDPEGAVALALLCHAVLLVPTVLIGAGTVVWLGPRRLREAVEERTG